jgi:hypothetical protein
MCFVKPNFITPVIIKSREDDIDIANKAYLRSNLAKE